MTESTSQPVWHDTETLLPDERLEVRIRMLGNTRPDYYRIGDRWYSLEDLDRWQMNTSRYWPEDRTWYLKTEQIEAWWGDPEDGIRPQVEEVDSR